MKKEYKILRQKMFETLEGFEKRLNNIVMEGWKPVNISAPQSGICIVLLEKN